MRKAAIFFGIAILLSSVSGSFAVAAPSLSVGWVDWTSDQNACVKKPSDKMRNSGFTASFKVVNNRTIIGAQGEYSAAIRCAANKKIAFVAVAGPSPQDALKFLNLIKEGF
jgi:hypothetical protein